MNGENVGVEVGLLYRRFIQCIASRCNSLVTISIVLSITITGTTRCCLRRCDSSTGEAVSVLTV